MRPKNAGKFNHHFFEIIDEEDKAYWLGFLMADGHILGPPQIKCGARQIHIHLSEKDTEHLKQFHVAIHSDKEVHLCGDGSIKSEHSSDIMCDDLAKYGCVPRKSLILEFPDLPVEMTRHYVRGYFDGDGCACLHKTRLFLTFLGTWSFLNELKAVLGVNNKLIRGANIWRLQIGSIKDCQRTVSWMYSGATIFLERKKAVVDEWLTIPKPGKGYRRKAA